MITLAFRKIFRLIALCAILSVSLTSCSVEISSVSNKRVKLKTLGEVETKSLSLDGDFRGIKVSGIFDVVYVPGDNCSVEVETHTELINLLKYSIEDGILNIGLNAFKTNKKIETLVLTVQAPKLEDISISGACDFTAKEGIRSEAMSIKASGASDILIRGVSANTLTFNVAGASDVTIYNMEVSHLDMSIAGASDVSINDLSVGSLDMSVAGSSDVKLTGHANESKFKLRGASDLNMREFKSDSLTTEVSGSSTIRQ